MHCLSLFGVNITTNQRTANILCLNVCLNFEIIIAPKPEEAQGKGKSE
jgi:hypothetical protein